MATSSRDCDRPVFRFAPSPNGRLHLGHAFSALMNERLAKRLGGRLLLRIEDIDVARCRPEFEQGIHDDLAWLGIRFDAAIRRQSEHFDDYRAALGRLQAKALIYPCFCSRGQIRARLAAGSGTGCDPDGVPLYPGTCRTLEAGLVVDRLARGEPHTWRLDMAAALRADPGPYGYCTFDEAGAYQVAAEPARWGDAVIARRDVPTSYHLSVVYDDAEEKVTHLVRGRDLEAATDLHVLLQRLLGLPVPRYRHHPLLLDPAGEKLAKSRGSQSLADLRASGVTPGAIRARLGFT